MFQIRDLLLVTTLAMAVGCGDKTPAPAPDTPPATTNSVQVEVDKLSADLISHDVDPSLKARSELRNMGSAAIPFVLDYMEREIQPDSREQNPLLHLLIQLGVDGKSEILTALADPSEKSCFAATVLTSLAIHVSPKTSDEDRTAIWPPPEKYRWMNDQDTKDALVKACAAPSLRTRAEAMEAASFLGLKEAVPSIRRLLDLDEAEFNAQEPGSVRVRKEQALGALARLSDSEKENNLLPYLDSYLKMLTEEAPDGKAPDGLYIRAMLPIRLSKMKSETAFRMLMAMCDDSRPDWQKGFGLFGLRLYPRPEVQVLARRLFREGKEDTETRALATVAACEGEKIIPELVGYLGGSDQSIRQSAIAALGETGSRKALPPLYGVLNRKGGSPEVRQVERRMALVAIGNLGFEEATNTVAALEQDPDPEIKAMAERMLSEIRRHNRRGQPKPPTSDDIRVRKS